MKSTKFINDYRWSRIARITLFLSILLLPCITLTNCTSKKTEAKPARDIFKHPDIPVMITDTKDQADFYITHYWDGFPFADTAAYASVPDKMEPYLLDYLIVLPRVSRDVMTASLGRMIDSTLTFDGSFWYFTGVLSKYLYDPNSPFRNEELYADFIDHIIASDKLNETEKTAFRYELKEINKNRMGSIAADFRYVRSDGRQDRMHSIHSEYTLIFFYNPDCPDCARVKAELQASPVISMLLDEGRLALLAVYPDEDLAAWRNYSESIPAGWINSHTASQEVKESLYSLRAIPSLYLLDKDKRVLLRDATLEAIEQRLLI